MRIRTIDWVVFYALWVVFVLLLPFLYLTAYVRSEAHRRYTPRISYRGNRFWGWN